ncbi:MAG: L,D-transpeptidase family protein [Desulfovibrionaceae bacterium]|jgi:murein L,D-transpeptidase YafK|nr:L,D-transpeptidase family protein [Desulfovibrionaceae bacterium]
MTNPLPTARTAPHPDRAAARAGIGLCPALAPLLAVALLALLALQTFAPRLALAAQAAQAAQAENGWQLHLGSEPYAPPTFLAIDKNSQHLYLFHHESPLSLAATFPCTTGQELGDKQREGDLRTPEGVYFVERRLSSGLDYDLYGKEAYTLNYPNPVDRLRGKSGSGIWIHGRGHAITPRETKGCVALNTPDLASLRGRVPLGTPVIIARDLQWQADGASPHAADDADAVDAKALEQRVNDWARAWERRSDDFFAFYDPGTLGKRQRATFRAFRAHKERLFDGLPWVQVMVADLQVLPGPGYWVTSFGQYYRTASLTSEGVKRLYWIKGDDGVFRIVGREWDRGRLGLEDRYKERVRREIAPLIEAWRSAWQKADLDAYMAPYAANAVQGDLAGARAIRDYKARVWQDNPPKSVRIDDMQLRLDPDGVAIRFTQRYQSRSGYSDTGIKQLVLAPTDTGWRIVREDWSAR